MQYQRKYTFQIFFSFFLFFFFVLPGWSPIQSSLMGALFFYTIFIFGDHGYQVIVHPRKRENFLVPASPPVLPARRCPCPSPVRGGLCQQAELREEGGEQAIWGGGASTWAELFAFLKPNWEKIFEKVKVSLVDVVDCFVYICVSSWKGLCGERSRYAK